MQRVWLNILKGFQTFRTLAFRTQAFCTLGVSNFDNNPDLSPNPNSITLKPNPNTNTNPNPNARYLPSPTLLKKRWVRNAELRKG